MGDELGNLVLGLRAYSHGGMSPWDLLGIVPPNTPGRRTSPTVKRRRKSKNARKAARASRQRNR